MTKQGKKTKKFLKIQKDKTKERIEGKKSKACITHKK